MDKENKIRRTVYNKSMKIRDRKIAYLTLKLEQAGLTIKRLRNTLKIAECLET